MLWVTGRLYFASCARRWIRLMRGLLSNAYASSLSQWTTRILHLLLYARAAPIRVCRGKRRPQIRPPRIVEDVFTIYWIIALVRYKYDKTGEVGKYLLIWWDYRLLWIDHPCSLSSLLQEVDQVKSNLIFRTSYNVLYLNQSGNL